MEKIKAAEARSLQVSYDFVNEKYINEPTRGFSEGELVSYGAWDEVFIVDVMDEGKVYQVSCYREREKNREMVVDTDVQFVPWHNIFPLEGHTAEIFREKESFSFGFGSTSISSLIGMYYSSGIDMEPEYQRGYIWEMEDKVLLLESIFNNVDIGKFVLIEREFDGGPSFEILDGKQRLKTLMDFYEGRWEYEDLKFSELGFEDRTHFSMYPVSYARTHPLSMEQKLKYFLKLNTMGRPQDPSHLERVRKMAEKLR